MKRIIHTIIFAGMVAGLTAGACGEKKPAEDKKSGKPSWVVPTHRDSIEVVVRNPESCRKYHELWYEIRNHHSDSILSFGVNAHTFEIWKNDRWEGVPVKFSGVTYDLKEGCAPKSEAVLKVDLGCYRLEPGHYRFGVPMTISPVALPDSDEYRRVPPHKKREYVERFNVKAIVTTEFDME